MADEKPIVPPDNPPPVVPPVPAPPVPVPAPPMFSKEWFALKANQYLPTNWRSISGVLVLNAVVAVLTYYGFITKPIPVPDVPVPIFEGSFGWVEPTAAERATTLEARNVYQFAQTEAGAMNLAGDPGGDAFLWKLVIKARGEHLPTLDQGSVGSCVGHGWATAINYLIAIQASLNRGPPIDPSVIIAPEVIYGGSRVNANGGRSRLLGDGSNGSWAARFVTSDGVAARGKYGEYDVSKYSETNCRTLGRLGIKGELLAECKKNPVGSTALISNADEAEKAIRNGYPISICSNVGFAGQSSRDANGFLRESIKPWAHCMACLGVTKDGKAFFIMNSWGENWVKGPTGPGEPPAGGFWIDRPTMDKMMGQGDSYAVSDARGFPRKTIKPEDWIVSKPSFSPRGNNAPDRNLKPWGALYALAP